MVHESRWCNHCQKNDHNDAECWSTRSIHERDYMMYYSPTVTAPPPFKAAPCIGMWLNGQSVNPVAQRALP